MRKVKNTLKGVVELWWLLAVVVGTVCLMSVVSGVRVRLEDADPSVERTMDTVWYDPEFKVETPHPGALPGGIEYTWTFQRYDASIKGYVPLEDARVTVEEPTRYQMLVRVKNETKTEAHLKLRAFLPVAVLDGAQAAADELSFKGRLEMDPQFMPECMAEGQLDLTNANGYPIVAYFTSCSNAVAANPDGTIQDVLNGGSDGDLVEFWGLKGEELKLAAGEECTIAIGFAAEPVRDFEASTVMFPVGHPEKSGSYFSYMTLLSHKSKVFHVKTELRSFDEGDLPAMVYPLLYDEAKLISGTVRINGEPADDFVPAASTAEEQSWLFEPVSVPLETPDRVATLEYDVEMLPGRGRSSVENTVNVRDAYGSASTLVTVRMGNVTPMAIVAVVCLSISILGQWYLRS